MDRLFIFLQHLVPHHLLSRCTGALAGLRHPTWLKDWLIARFIGFFGVDMSEAQEPVAARYASFNEFFTRPLREGARPLADADILCPADGAISQLGAISSGLLLQAKGRYFSAEELLGGDAALFGERRDGNLERREVTRAQSRQVRAGTSEHSLLDNLRVTQEMEEVVAVELWPWTDRDDVGAADALEVGACRLPEVWP